MNRYLILFAVILCSCHTTKRELQKTDLQSDNLDYSFQNDTAQVAYVFTCKTDTASVLVEDFNIYKFPFTMKRCLQEECFLGNEEACKQIIPIIEVAKNSYPLILRKNKLRGPHIFETHLKYADNLEITIGTGPREIPKHMLRGVEGSWWLSSSYEFIDNIEGKSGWKEIDLWVRKEAGKYSNLEGLNRLSDEWKIEAHRAMLLTLTNAYKEGKVVLKKYNKLYGDEWEYLENKHEK